MIPSKHGPSGVKKKKPGVQVMRARSKSRFVQKPQGRSGPVTRTFDESGTMPWAPSLTLAREYKDMP